MNATDKNTWVLVIKDESNYAIRKLKIFYIMEDKIYITYIYERKFYTTNL